MMPAKRQIVTRRFVHMHARGSFEEIIFSIPVVMRSSEEFAKNPSTSITFHELASVGVELVEKIVEEVAMLGDIC